MNQTDLEKILKELEMVQELLRRIAIRIGVKQAIRKLNRIQDLFPRVEHDCENAQCGDCPWHEWAETHNACDLAIQVRHILGDE